MRSKKYLGVSIAFLIAAIAPAAQSPLADWLTDGGNPQRTAWQKDEHLLSVSNVKGMRLLWKYKTDNQAREMHCFRR